MLPGVVLWISAPTRQRHLRTRLINLDDRPPVPRDLAEFYYGVAADPAVLLYVFEFTPLGRRLLFVGRGRSVRGSAASTSSRIRWGSFIVCGLFSALAGVMYAGSLGGADPASGQTFLLPAFAAAFLGATAIYPGRFNPIGTSSPCTSSSRASPGCSSSASRASCSSCSTAERWSSRWPCRARAAAGGSKERLALGLGSGSAVAREACPRGRALYRCINGGVG